MRHFLTAAAALAAGGLLATTFAQAQSAYIAGGPAQLGSVCQVSAGNDWDHAYGYTVACPKPAKVAMIYKKKKKSKRS